MSAKLPFDFEAALLGIRILHVPVHRGEVEPHARRQGYIAEYVGKYWRPSLCRRKTHTDLAEFIDVHRIFGREKRIGDCTQRYAIIEQSEAAANHCVPRGKWRPCESRARGDVVYIGRDGFQE